MKVQIEINWPDVHLEKTINDESFKDALIEESVERVKYLHDHGYIEGEVILDYDNECYRGWIKFLTNP